MESKTTHFRCARRKLKLPLLPPKPPNKLKLLPPPPTKTEAAAANAEAKDEN
jgi:hypothetical protein